MSSLLRGGVIFSWPKTASECHCHCLLFAIVLRVYSMMFGLVTEKDLLLSVVVVGGRL